MILIAVFLGIIQGITEFLPVSSSAHLLVIPWLFGFQSPGLSFDAAIHIGTSVALIWYFWDDLSAIVKQRGELLKLILIASIPGGAVGFLGSNIIDRVFHEGSMAIAIAAIGMLLATMVLWWIDSRASQRKELGKLTRRDAVLIGIGQALALVPGVSRSGSTIGAGLALGLTRKDAARFSFLIGTPIALGAGLYKFLGVIKDGPSGSDIAAIVVGIIVSALVGVAVIKWLLAYLTKHDLKVFLIYRFGFAILILTVLAVRAN